MGVDFRAFAGYGVALSITDRSKFDDVQYDLEKLARGDSDQKFEIQDWGALGYGDHGGYVLLVEASAVTIDLRRSNACKSLPEASPEWYAMILDGVRRLHMHGVESVGEIGWILGGRIC